MNFDALVDRLQSLFDVGQTRATDVANERLSSMLGSSKSLRGLVTLGTTVSGTATYALPSTVVEVYRVSVAYTSGTVWFEGTESLDALLDLTAGNAYGCGNWYAVQPDTDSSMNTENLYLSPTPTASGATITGRCAVLPATITYGSSTALPIPIDTHRHLLAGCRAELLDEDSRQDESGKLETVFEAGVKRLAAREAAKGKGSGGHRMRMANYDFRR